MRVTAFSLIAGVTLLTAPLDAIAQSTNPQTWREAIEAGYPRRTPRRARSSV